MSILLYILAALVWLAVAIRVLRHEPAKDAKPYLGCDGESWMLTFASMAGCALLFAGMHV